MTSKIERREVGLFSGGKDSYVACKVHGVKEVLYCKTGIGLNFDFVLKICQKEGWKLNVVYPKEGETYEDFVRRFGFPKSGIHNSVMGFLKWHPMRTWVKQQKEDILFISGRRKKESRRRMRMKSNREYVETEGMKFFAPIYSWTTKQVYDYIRDNQLELSPTYETLHMSGDCLCGAFAQQGESQLLYTFHIELAEVIMDLEKKYGGHWGNGTSVTGSSKQANLDDLVCMECRVH